MIRRWRYSLRRTIGALLALCIGCASVPTLWAQAGLQDHGPPDLGVAVGAAASMVSADAAAAEEGCAGLCLCMCHCAHAQAVVAPAAATPASSSPAAFCMYLAIWDVPTSVALDLQPRPPLV